MGKPDDLTKTILKEQSIQLTLESEYMIRDIAMYFGEVLVKNHCSLYWGYHTKTKKDSFANLPLLMGFEDRDFNPPFHASFDPVFIVQGFARRLIDHEENQHDLVRMYEKWKRMIF